MSNLTISVNDELIKRARMRALQQGTSLSAKVREFLAQYARGGDVPSPEPAPGLPVFDGACGLRQGIDPCSNKSMLQAIEE